MATATLEAPVQTEIKAPATEVTDELLKSLQEGKTAIGDLPRELRLKAMEKLQEDGAEETPAAEPKIEETPVEKPKAKDKPKEEEDYETRISKAKADQKRLADEANTAEQKAKAAKERRDKALKDLEEAKKMEVKLPEELLSEESQVTNLKNYTRLNSEFEALKKIVLDRDNAEVETHETNHRKVTEAMQFQELDQAQAKFPALKLEESFETANAKYGAWLTELETASGIKEKTPNITPVELRNEAVKMWNADPEFQKKIRNQPPKDMDKVMILLTAWNKKQAAGGSVIGNLLEDFEGRGVLDDMLQKVAQKAAADAATRTAKALASDEVNPIGPGDGASKGYNEKAGWTNAKAKQTIEQINNKQKTGGSTTREERAMLSEAMSFLATA